MAKLTFFGATEGVTGSAYLLETGQATILLECGLVQGGREEKKANEKPFPFSVGQLDAVVLSHAHLDHSGRLPKLVADGYGGAVFMTDPTNDLLEILLKDAASLQELKSKPLLLHFLPDRLEFRGLQGYYPSEP